MATSRLSFPRAISSPAFRLRLLVIAPLSASTLLLIAATRPNPVPIYSVAAIRAGLTRTPDAWVGRTVIVRAVVAAPCVTWMGGATPVCITWEPALLDSPTNSADVALPLRGVPQPALLTLFGRLPLVNQLMPSPQQIHWGTPTAYRVQLLAAPHAACGTVRCYKALLLDTAPGSL